MQKDTQALVSVECAQCHRVKVFIEELVGYHNPLLWRLYYETTVFIGICSSCMDALEDGPRRYTGYLN